MGLSNRQKIRLLVQDAHASTQLLPALIEQIKKQEAHEIVKRGIRYQTKYVVNALGVDKVREAFDSSLHKAAEALEVAVETQRSDGFDRIAMLVREQKRKEAERMIKGSVIEQLNYLISTIGINKVRKVIDDYDFSDLPELLNEVT